jgi:hypothetical protein
MKSRYQAGFSNVFSCKQWFDQHVVALVAQIKRKKIKFRSIENSLGGHRVL